MVPELVIPFYKTEIISTSRLNSTQIFPTISKYYGGEASLSAINLSGSGASNSVSAVLSRIFGQRGPAAQHAVGIISPNKRDLKPSALRKVDYRRKMPQYALHL